MSMKKSRGFRGLDDLRGLHLPPEYYYAPPYDDLRLRDWAMLIKEALRFATVQLLPLRR